VLEHLLCPLLSCCCAARRDTFFVFDIWTALDDMAESASCETMAQQRAYTTRAPTRTLFKKRLNETTFVDKSDVVLYTKPHLWIRVRFYYNIRSSYDVHTNLELLTSWFGKHNSVNIMFATNHEVVNIMLISRTSIRHSRHDCPTKLPN
jgi:hypothetical protein